jgi:hypothetical protein
MVRRLIAKRYGPEWEEIPPIEIFQNSSTGEIEYVGDSDPSRLLEAMPKHKAARDELLAALRRGELFARLENGCNMDRFYWDTGSAYEAMETGCIPSWAVTSLKLSPWAEDLPLFVDANSFEGWLSRRLDPAGGAALESTAAKPTARPALPDGEDRPNSKNWDRAKYLYANRTATFDGLPPLDKAPRGIMTDRAWCKANGVSRDLLPQLRKEAIAEMGIAPPKGRPKSRQNKSAK